MRKLVLYVMAALLAGTSAGPASAQTPPGNPHGCINPAGHERGWCKRDGGSRRNAAIVSGSVIAINGDLAQLRQDNGAPVTIDQTDLLRDDQPLQLGAHYVLDGYYSNNLFIAESYGSYSGANATYPSNGYPYPGATASVRGIITAVSGDHLTIMQGLFSTVTINDQQALDNGTAQNLTIGRSVTAWGYWSGGTFYATSIG